MPLFHEASCVYDTAEVNFMRSCYSTAAIILEESDHNYSASDLASSVLMLYKGGNRNHASICELAARLAHRRFLFRHGEDAARGANSDMEPDTLA